MTSSKSSNHLLGSTPVRRLGLSNKRKSVGGIGNIDEEQSVDHEKESQTSMPKIRKLGPSTSVEKITESNDVKSLETAYNDGANLNEHEVRFSLEELKNLEKIVLEKEMKIKSVKENSVIIHKIKALENLNQIWKNGCKNALLYLINYLENKQDEPVNVKKLLQELGIWRMMLVYFQHDPDLNCLEYNSEDEK